ncbi:MAG: hypothetical protein DRP56_07035 [Planctomycetota bacterium]|nr:MAG: hypothetical protein DRP56_07035 [Planctomycetota bacterium]
MIEVLQTEKNTVVSSGPVRLKWSEKDRTVVIEPEDDDKYTMKVEEIIQTCNIKQQRSEYEYQFATLKNILGNWIHQQKDKIDKSFVTVRDTRLLFLVISKNIEYDDAIEDELTKLDWGIANTPLLKDISLSVQSLPQCDNVVYESFLSPPVILEYTG